MTVSEKPKTAKTIFFTNMKYSIGYQLPDEYDSTYNLCSDYKEHISSVYFSWANQPGGRMPLCPDDKESIEQVSGYQLEELKEIRSLGIELTLLLNANCYGENANSAEFAKKTLDLCRYLKTQADISSVTTTSPFIAGVIKKHFASEISVTASVNMRVDNILTMQQLSNSFDGFYIRKELNRNLTAISELKNWCEENGKNLYILANSGCLGFCGFQTYHDNLVAHHKYMQQSEDAFPAPCWEYLYGLNKDEALAKILGASWIRPEDVENYTPYFSEMKLATRMHSSPRKVVSAYIRGKFTGNIMDLTEPSYSPLFRGCVLDNTLFPDDWFEVTSRCGKNCHKCGYCKKTAESIKRTFTN